MWWWLGKFEVEKFQLGRFGVEWCLGLAFSGEKKKSSIIILI